MRNRKLFGFNPTSPKALLISLMIILVVTIAILLTIYRPSKNVHQEHQESQVTEPDTYKYDEVDEKPELINIPKALYPTEHRGTGSPEIVVSVLVDTSGIVVDAFILKTNCNGIFAESALKAARKAKFTPAKRSGRPVRVWLAIPISFTLE